MNIEEILDDMDDLLDRSRPIPFAAHKAVIDADRMRELLNSAHLNIPAEIKRAKLIDSDCDRIINEAREKAEAICLRLFCYRSAESGINQSAALSFTPSAVASSSTSAPRRAKRPTVTTPGI